MDMQSRNLKFKDKEDHFYQLITYLVANISLVEERLLSSEKDSKKLIDSKIHLSEYTEKIIRLKALHSEITFLLKTKIKAEKTKNKELCIDYKSNLLILEEKNLELIQQVQKLNTDLTSLEKAYSK